MINKNNCCVTFIELVVRQATYCAIPDDASGYLHVDWLGRVNLGCKSFGTLVIFLTLFDKSLHFTNVWLHSDIVLLLSFFQWEEPFHVQNQQNLFSTSLTLVLYASSKCSSHWKSSSAFCPVQFMHEPPSPICGLQMFCWLFLNIQSAQKSVKSTQGCKKGHCLLQTKLCPC